MRLLLLFLPLAASYFHPRCVPNAVEFATPKRYIFLFDLKMQQDKFEKWKFLAKSMSCALPINENVTLGVAVTRGDEIQIRHFWNSSAFPDQIENLTADSTGYTCLNLPRLKEAIDEQKFEEGMPIHVVSLLDTSEIPDCGMDNEFEKIFDSTGSVKLDEVHLCGVKAESYHMKIMDEWEDIDVNNNIVKSPDYKFLATYGSLHDQIQDWAQDKKRWTWPRRPPIATTTKKSILTEEEFIEMDLKTSETPIILEEMTTEDLMVEATEGSAKTWEMSSIESSGEGSGTEEPSSTNATEVLILTKEEVIGEMKLGPIKATTDKRENLTSVAFKLKEMTNVNEFVSTLETTTVSVTTTNETSIESKKSEESGSFFEWLSSEWLHIIMFFVVVLIILIALLICLISKLQKEKKRPYRTLEVDDSLDKIINYKTLEGDCLHTAIEMKTPPRTIHTTSIESAANAELQDPHELTPLPIPHAEEGAVEPYSPALPSPYETRNSEIALTPIQPMSYVEKVPAKKRQPAVTLKNYSIYDI